MAAGTSGVRATRPCWDCNGVRTGYNTVNTNTITVTIGGGTGIGTVPVGSNIILVPVCVQGDFLDAVGMRNAFVTAVTLVNISTSAFDLLGRYPLTVIS